VRSNSNAVVRTFRYHDSYTFNIPNIANILRHPEKLPPHLTLASETEIAYTCTAPQLPNRFVLRQPHRPIETMFAFKLLGVGALAPVSEAPVNNDTPSSEPPEPFSHGGLSSHPVSCEIRCLTTILLWLLATAILPHKFEVLLPSVFPFEQHQIRIHYIVLELLDLMRKD